MAKTNIKSSSDEISTESKVGSSQSKILKDLANKLSDDYFPSQDYSSSKEESGQDQQVQKINKMITDSAKKISGEEDSQNEKKSYPESTPKSIESFNGVSDSKEEKTLNNEKVKHLERENLKLKHKLELLHEDFKKEKLSLNKSVRDLKSELHRTSPLTDAKLFSFSRELRNVATTVQALSDEGNNLVDDSQQASERDNFPFQEPAKDHNPINSTTHRSTPTQVKNISKSKNENLNEETKKVDKEKTKKKIKLLPKQKVASGVSVGTLIAFITIGAMISNSNKVDNEIVDTFLEDKKAGQVQGATTKNAINRPEQRNNQIIYQDAEWEIFRDDFLGLQLEYPSNAVDLLHTGNTITFLRYDGYLYKAQRIASEESTQEYVERTGVGGLEYLQEETDFNGSEALHLTLAEDIEYPGNRYIVQDKGYIFDIWYASQSAHFKTDDLKYVDKMLNTTRFP